MSDQSPRYSSKSGRPIIRCAAARRPAAAPAIGGANQKCCSIKGTNLGRLLGELPILDRLVP
jgi:hypothetical protein